ncbi:uncharacterized protein DS421_7g222450 [Arachis hypogaea]|uniref:GRF-type domain-containing protein n=1 Tax=Arachis hypogaea TaxID=3818 RepID=A0A445CI53_ARAHY|nr:uncharacterized protein DS421_7g222450 [Arachis hypogaea]RYR50609.1 hypothetical protein Ahy_A07g037240 [Arachis hypogaea]
MSDPEQSSTSNTRRVWRKNMVGSSSNASEGKKAKFQHPKCKCGTYVVMQQSGTAKNPDRIFLGCSYYGVNGTRHCNFFVWLDELIAKRFGHEDDNDIQGRMMMLENRLEQLEFKIKDEYEGK